MPTTDAVVVKIHEYAESSAVAALITAELGLVRAVAKGAKRIKNGYRGPLDKGLLYSVRLRRRGHEGLFHLNSASVREPLPGLRRDPTRFHAAALVIEVAADLMRENEPHAELFRLSTFTLKAIDRAPPSRIALAATFFLARAAQLTGHVPEIAHCVACGRPLEGAERALIGPIKGGVLHLECGQGEPGAHSISPAALSLLALLWRVPAAEVLATDHSTPVLRELRRMLEAWLEHVLERRFRAAAAMEREFARSDRHE